MGFTCTYIASVLLCATGTARFAVADGQDCTRGVPTGTGLGESSSYARRTSGYRDHIRRGESYISSGAISLSRFWGVGRRDLCFTA